MCWCDDHVRRLEQYPQRTNHLFDGQSYLTETVDTSGHGHTADYLLEVAESAVVSTEWCFGCKVSSFVTDNASNMVEMQWQLAEDNDADILSYVWSAHYLNLLAKDVEISGVKEHIVQIVKYFRNHHLPAASYKAAGGKKLVVPQEVRWDTLADCLQSYLDNWSTILKVCGDHSDNIDSKISKKVRDIRIKRNAEAYVKRITVALDKNCHMTWRHHNHWTSQEKCNIATDNH